jgi:hypothetical protein
MTIRYKLGCDLSYEVKSPTTFIFNFEVARLERGLSQTAHWVKAAL